ncbi:MAG: hypothetical protein ACYTAN_14535 [Planctomycetota bacterium]|jgi:hypothetical protein
MSLTEEQLKNAHVEITCFPCSACGGHGGTSKATEAGVERTPCAACEETGRERVLVRLEDLPGLWARKEDAAETEGPPAPPEPRSAKLRQAPRRPFRAAEKIEQCEPVYVDSMNER